MTPTFDPDLSRITAVERLLHSTAAWADATVRMAEPLLDELPDALRATLAQMERWRDSIPPST